MDKANFKFNPLGRALPKVQSPVQFRSGLFFFNSNKTVRLLTVEFIMKAISVSEYAKMHMAPSDLEELECQLPCECHETDERAIIDNTFLIALDWMTDREDFIHRDMLVIEP